MNTRKLQRANISTDLFFVATCQVKGDNELHLIQVSTEASNNAAASATSSAAHNAKLATQCLKIFRCDYGEIVHMAAHLTNPDRLFIVGARKTVLVDMSAGSNATTTTRNETDEGGSTPADTEASTNSVDTLTVRHEFINDASSSVRQVLWHPDESNEDLVARLTTKAVEVVKLGANDNTPTFRRVVIDADQCDQLHWNPHRLSEIAYAHGKSLIGVDTRQTGSQTAWRIDDADTLRLKTFDFNPNALHSLCCGGVDGMVRFYDVRTTAQPVLRLSGNHEHWIRSVLYNKFNDRLVLSAGSDGVVNVYNIYSASSKLEHDESAEAKSLQTGQLTKDKLLTSMTEHVDSVWSAAWSASDKRLFASVSFSGRVVASKLTNID